MTLYSEPIKGAGAERRDELGNFNKAYRKHPHRGADWGFSNGSEGKDILAMHSGLVFKNFSSPSLGWCVITKDEDGVYILYAHLKAQGIAKGKLIVGGASIIGQIGNTGSASVGAHLHVAVSKNSQPHLAPFEELLNPFKLVDAEKPAVKKTTRKKKA